MYAIKNKKSQLFAKHTGETNGYGQYVEYPWELVSDINQAQQYTTFIHANEIAFWHLDHYEEWLIVNVETGEETSKQKGKYIPV